ncbi:hypothetical protein GPALN_013182 [Globodera pallida]|nr:hypothetical protein GPALN_013182 [Globodera pallida]
MTMLTLEIEDETGKISNVVCFEKKQEGEKIIIGDKCLMRIRVKSQKNNEGNVNVGFVLTDVKALSE